jgi:hypothetical protein
MLFAGLLSVLGKPCPLTTLEYALRGRVGAFDPGGEGFIIRIANRLIFPAMNARLLAILTVAAVLIVISIYLWRPPTRARQLMIMQK